MYQVMLALFGRPIFTSPGTKMQQMLQQIACSRAVRSFRLCGRCAVVRSAFSEIGSQWTYRRKQITIYFETAQRDVKTKGNCEVYVISSSSYHMSRQHRKALWHNGCPWHNWNKSSSWMRYPNVTWRIILPVYLFTTELRHTCCHGRLSSRMTDLAYVTVIVADCLLSVSWLWFSRFFLLFLAREFGASLCLVLPPNSFSC